MTVHPALELARQARLSADPIAVASPAKLYELADGNTELYKHAMVEAGHIVQTETGEPHDPCPIKGCGWSPGDTQQMSLM